MCISARKNSKRGEKEMKGIIVLLILVGLTSLACRTSEVVMTGTSATSEATEKPKAAFAVPTNTPTPTATSTRTSTPTRTKTRTPTATATQTKTATPPPTATPPVTSQWSIPPKPPGGGQVTQQTATPIPNIATPLPTIAVTNPTAIPPAPVGMDWKEIPLMKQGTDRGVSVRSKEGDTVSLVLTSDRIPILFQGDQMYMPLTPVADINASGTDVAFIGSDLRTVRMKSEGQKYLVTDWPTK